MTLYQEVYQATILGEAKHQLAQFEEVWPTVYPVTDRSRRSNWSSVMLTFCHLSERQRAAYTMNTIEALHMTLGDEEPCAVPERRGGLQADLSVMEEYQQGVDDDDQELEWAMNQFAIIFEGRVPTGGLGPNSLTQNPA